MRVLFLLGFLAAMCGLSFAQSKVPRPSVVSGQITIEGEPAAGVTVILSANSAQNELAGRATTDQDGHYTVSGLAPGQYYARPFAPAAIGPSSGMPLKRGTVVTLSEGEIVDGIDFFLSKGGVITGRITDSHGRPLVGQEVYLSRVDESGQQKAVLPYDYEAQPTDDRGVYRVFGLEAGRYIVSAGRQNPAGDGARPFPRAYYPGVVDSDKAAVIDLGAGQTSTGIDIQLGKPPPTYVARGHLIDAYSGKPVFGVAVGYARLGDGDQIQGAVYGWQPDAFGEFRIEGLTPGRYAALTLLDQGSQYYSDPTTFVIENADVVGLEVKMRQGASISGVVVLEGSHDPSSFQNLGSIEIMAYPQATQGSYYRLVSSSIAVDGSFRIGGLSPGKFGLSLNGPTKGYHLSRVERNGVQAPGAIELEAQDQVTGLRVIVSHGTGSIRGQVNVVGGQLPSGSTLHVIAIRPGNSTNASAIVDVRGRFLIENLPDGDYQVTVLGFPPGRTTPRLSQTISISNGIAPELSFTLDPTRSGGQQ